MYEKDRRGVDELLIEDREDTVTPEPIEEAWWLEKPADQRGVYDLLGEGNIPDVRLNKIRRIVWTGNGDTLPEWRLFTTSGDSGTQWAYVELMKGGGLWHVLVDSRYEMMDPFGVEQLGLAMIDSFGITGGRVASNQAEAAKFLTSLPYLKKIELVKDNSLVEGTDDRPTPAQAKKLVADWLTKNDLPFTKITAKTVDFQDLARDAVAFVKIWGWKPNPKLEELKKIAKQNGFRVETDGPFGRLREGINEAVQIRIEKFPGNYTKDQKIVNAKTGEHVGDLTFNNGRKNPWQVYDGGKRVVSPGGSDTFDLKTAIKVAKDYFAQKPSGSLREGENLSNEPFGRLRESLDEAVAVGSVCDVDMKVIRAEAKKSPLGVHWLRIVAKTVVERGNKVRVIRLTGDRAEVESTNPVEAMLPPFTVPVAALKPVNEDVDHSPKGVYGILEAWGEPLDDSTPMLGEEKQQIKLIKMGGYYETFDDDAAVFSDIMNVTKTKDKNGRTIAGVPVHMLSQAKKKLEGAGYDVIISESTEDRASLELDEAKNTPMLTEYFNLDERLYQFIVHDPALKKLATKIGQDKRDHGSVMKLWLDLAEKGAKKYVDQPGLGDNAQVHVKQFGGITWSSEFPKEVCAKVAQRLADEFHDKMPQERSSRLREDRASLELDEAKRRSRDEADALLQQAMDRIDPFVDKLQAQVQSIHGGIWGYVKDIMTFLIGNEMDFTAGSFEDALKRGNLDHFYIDDRALSGAKKVESNYAMKPVGVREVARAIKELKRVLATIGEPERLREDTNVKRRQDDDEEDLPTEPQEDDYTLTPTGSLGSKIGVGIVGGKSLGAFSDEKTALKAVRDDMKRHNFYPTVWWVSDHGNAWPVDPKTGKEIKYRLRESQDFPATHHYPNYQEEIERVMKAIPGAAKAAGLRNVFTNWTPKDKTSIDISGELTIEGQDYAVILRFSPGFGGKISDLTGEVTPRGLAGPEGAGLDDIQVYPQGTDVKKLIPPAKYKQLIAIYRHGDWMHYTGSSFVGLKSGKRFWTTAFAIIDRKVRAKIGDINVGPLEPIFKPKSLRESTGAPLGKNQKRALSEIALEIYDDWKPVNFAAKPYLEAMSSLQSIDDDYIMDPGSSIVAYFLSNAKAWKGDVAKRIKKELSDMLKGSHRLREDRELPPDLFEAAGACPPVITEDDYDDWKGGRGQWADPKVKAQWKGYVVDMAYETVTPESAEEGDAADRGWDFQGHKFDYLEEALEDSDVSFKGWLEWSSSPPRPGDWITSEEEQELSTGASTTHNLFIKRGDKQKLTQAEMTFVHKKLRLTGRF